MKPILTAVIALALTPTLAAASQQRAPDSVGITIRPASRQDRVDLEVTIRFPAPANQQTPLTLPQDRYGTPDMHEAVTDVRGLDGTTIEPADDASKRNIAANASGDAAVRYVLSWNPQDSSGLAFSPSVDASHFHFFGSQWMPRHGDDEEEFAFTIEFADTPPGWSVFSSFGIGPGPHEITGSYDDLVTTFIAGGEYRSNAFEVNGQSIVTALYGGFEMDDDRIFNAVRAIVTAEREQMPATDQPFYTVCITERERIRAGTSFLNSFVCLVRPDVSQEGLMLLLAHEMMHYWLPNMGQVAGPDADETEMRYEWIHEGFAEYLARRIMLDEGLAPLDWFVEQFNEDLEDLAFSPAGAITYEELRRRENNGEFTNIEERIAYYRGALIGLAWDDAIRRASAGGRTLLDAISEMVEGAAARGGRMPEDDFAELMAGYGIDVPATLQRHIIDGRLIDPLPEVFAPEYRLVRTIAPGVEPGFDLRRSFLEDKVIGVETDSPAYEAGLRDGMPILELRNAWRHSSSWSADEPLTVAVDEEGRRREIAFHPRPTEIPVWRYEPARDQESR